jgi:hypothetical protein
VDAASAVRPAAAGEPPERRSEPFAVRRVGSLDVEAQAREALGETRGDDRGGAPCVLYDNARDRRSSRRRQRHAAQRHLVARARREPSWERLARRARPGRACAPRRGLRAFARPDGDLRRAQPVPLNDAELTFSGGSWHRSQATGTPPRRARMRASSTPPAAG